tara:strand:- start:118 stop:663 length:546 start_codon:yes stop_codon:yes gene_type:complete
MIVGSVITIVLTAIILRYVLELEEENCECAKAWQHQFIKYFAPIVIIVALIPLFVSSKKLISAVRTHKALMALFVVYYLTAVIYYINIVLYFLKLKYSKCACARDWKQYGLLYPVIGFGLILLVVIILTIISVFGLVPMMVKRLAGKKLKGKKNNSAKELLTELNNTLNKSSNKSVKSAKK